MEMENEDDISKLDIEKTLKEKYDLGFLLDQIKDKKNRSFYSLSIIDVLRFIPKFNEAINLIREDLHINPQAIKSELGNLIGKSKFLNYITTSKQIARGLGYPPPNKEWEIVSNKIKAWKKRGFSSLPKRVADVRLKVLGKIPHAWQEAIEDYILFEKISSIPIIYRRPGVEVCAKEDTKTSEPYIEIKIYADTDIRLLRRINWWKNVQKLLPSYTNPKRWDEYLVLSRFLQYVLRKHLKLTQNQALEWLKKNDLIAPDSPHSSQELSRFEELLISTSSK